MSIEIVGNILTETKEVANMAYSPMIKEWELYFERVNGYDNRTAVGNLQNFGKTPQLTNLRYPENVCWAEGCSGVKDSTMETRFSLRMLN